MNKLNWLENWWIDKINWWFKLKDELAKVINSWIYWLTDEQAKQIHTRTFYFMNLLN